ncbi:MAG TPA: hypothetical protein VFB54_16105 [Burkholderiales bacterium]|nr:hypothetical protein [Burkholderiales bacterium]
MSWLDRLPLWHGAAFALVAVGCAGAIFQSHRWAQREEARLIAARGERSTLQQQSLQAEAQAKRSAQARAHYAILVGKGAISPGRRIEWMEAVQAASRRASVRTVEYELGPEMSPQAAQGQATAVRLSPMKLRLRLAHEGGLLEFLRALESQPIGVFRLDACVIRRLPQPGDAALEAHCTLSWLTVPASTELKS